MTGHGLFADIWREWRLANADRVMPLTLVIIGLSTLLAMQAGSLRTQHRETFQETLKRENSLQRSFLESAFDESASSGASDNDLSPTQTDRQFELQMSARSPDLMRYTGGIWWTIYPTSPLSSLSSGASGKWPDHYHHEGSSITRTLQRSPRLNPLLATVGTFDLTLLVGAILPLAVITLTYNVVGADREQGRWLLVAHHASSVPWLIVIRCMVRAGALAITVVAVVASWLLIAESSELSFTLLRNFLAWSIFLTAYLAFWTTLAVSVNSLPLTPSGSGLLLLLCWTVLVIAVPAAVQRSVNQTFQIPRQEELITAEEEVHKHVEQQSEQVWNDYLRQHPEIVLNRENPQQEYLLRDVALNRVIRSKVHDRLEVYYERLDDRESVLDRAQFLSPLLAWRTAADQFAGTSLRHHVEFAGKTLTYHERYISYFEPFSISGQELTLSDIQAIPQFNADQLQSSLHLSPLFLAGGSLLVWIAVVGAVSWWNLRCGANL